MLAAHRVSLSFTFFAVLACDHARERAETRRVTLPKTTTLPAMTLTVPKFLNAPVALASSDHPNAGYALAGAEQPGPDGFAARVQIERHDGKQPLCDGEWVTERREALEVRSCAAADLTTVLIPHAAGEILCWSQWHAFGDITAHQRTIADAIDATCTTITFQ